MKKTIERIGIMATKKRTTKKTNKKTNKKNKLTKKKVTAKKKTVKKSPSTAAKKPSWATELMIEIRRVLHLNGQTTSGIADIVTAVKMLADSNQKTLQALNVIAESMSAASGKNAALKPVAMETTPVKTKPTKKQTTAMKDLVTNAVESETQEVTKDQVTQALQEVHAKFGLEKVSDLLKEYGSVNVTGIKVEDYPNFYQACVKTTGAPAATV